MGAAIKRLTPVVKRRADVLQLEGVLGYLE